MDNYDFDKVHQTAKSLVPVRSRMMGWPFNALLLHYGDLAKVRSNFVKALDAWKRVDKLIAAGEGCCGIHL